jgi:Amt family ammonium transporter
VKNAFGYDDSLDVFGCHGVAGIVGAVGTGIFTSATLGGIGYGDGVTMGMQTWIQIKAVVITIIWGGIASFVILKAIDMVIGLRVSEEVEREGLDLAVHGEAAYHE